MIDNIRSAFSSIWGNKLRSLLTLLGVVIGVSSVTILVALGQGLKNDVSGLIQGFGTNVIVVVPGQINPSTGGSAQSANPADLISGDILTVKDMETISNLEQVREVAPISLVTGVLKNGDKVAASEAIVGTYPNFLEAFEVFELEKGEMIRAVDQGKVIVLSPTAKERLFGAEEAIGKKILLGAEEYSVIGVLAKSKTTSVMSQGVDSFTILPFDEATALNKNRTAINRVIAKADENADVSQVRDQIKASLITNHEGREDFSVLTQDDLLGLFDQFLTLATAMVSAIAAISLLVGGIGIMNIMLVTVTERTREIGLRKALGATRGMIMLQFLVEAIVVTLVGGLIGLGISLSVGAIIAANSPLRPEFSWPVIMITVAISVVIGVIFGLWPALHAARKDPIEALRYE